MKKNIVRVEPIGKSTNRRRFLKLGGLGVVGAGLLVACSDDDNGMGMMPDPDPEPDPDPDPDKIFDLGEGDLGVLNYAYALEQLEADFYTKVVNSFYGNISDEERQVLTDLYYHEVNHRDFFKAAITAAVDGNTDLVLPTLEFDYGNLDFGNREQVLTTASVLEDTGVAAYNGAGRLIADPNYLLIAGKIVSVEARHASAIRTLLNPGSADFAGDDYVTASNGLSAALDPSAILAAVGDTGFITTKFTANNLP
ncbi:ferritin-like domain-containing protein [Euzebyella marina]|uniref:Ferritin-like domain-containing protein n=1 Tax=Euzebyella marina TaxID=1761453 RepID=A0A3G2L361_9FLAO|nr:ferritin-like domain-containing protein [Euzebyella marina]AYN66641.1 ferritin-like domain-containing protein [Euzebyella marina]